MRGLFLKLVCLLVYFLCFNINVKAEKLDINSKNVKLNEVVENNDLGLKQNNTQQNSDTSKKTEESEEIELTNYKVENDIDKTQMDKVTNKKTYILHKKDNAIEHNTKKDTIDLLNNVLSKHLESLPDDNGIKNTKVSLVIKTTSNSGDDSLIEEIDDSKKKTNNIGNRLFRIFAGAGFSYTGGYGVFGGFELNHKTDDSKAIFVGLEGAYYFAKQNPLYTKNIKNMSGGDCGEIILDINDKLKSKAYIRDIASGSLMLGMKFNLSQQFSLSPYLIGTVSYSDMAYYKGFSHEGINVGYEDTRTGTYMKTDKLLWAEIDSKKHMFYKIGLGMKFAVSSLIFLDVRYQLTGKTINQEVNHYVGFSDEEDGYIEPVKNNFVYHNFSVGIGFYLW